MGINPSSSRNSLLYWYFLCITVTLLTWYSADHTYYLDGIKATWVRFHIHKAGRLVTLVMPYCFLGLLPKDIFLFTNFENTLSTGVRASQRCVHLLEKWNNEECGQLDAVLCAVLHRFGCSGWNQSNRSGWFATVSKQNKLQHPPLFIDGNSFKLSDSW